MEQKPSMKLGKMTEETTTANKNKTAVALTYNPNEEAPKIIATGRGYLADKILHMAKEHEIPVHQDNKLANTLSKLDIGEYIPPELYDVVAEVLVFVDNMDRMKGKLSEYKK